jgi:WD40 repeat protein
VTCLAFSPDSGRLACGGEGGVGLYDVRTGKLDRTLKSDDIVTSLAFLPGGKRLASGGWDRSIRLWDVSSGEEVLTLSGAEQAVYGVAFSPDGEALAAVGGAQDFESGTVAEVQLFLAPRRERGGVIVSGSKR